MKRFSRILAILLTACIICGVIVTAAFAEDASTYQTTNLGYNYDFQTTDVGAESTVFPSGSGAADTYSTRVVAQGAGENRYYRFASINTMEAPKTYRRDLMYGSYDKSAGTRLDDYSYLTIDFDIAADGYAVPIGYEITSDTTVTADDKATKVTDTETGITTITKTTKTTYYVRTEYYIFYPDAVPTEEALNQAISDQATKFRTQLDAALKDIADNDGRSETTSTSEDGKTVNVMLHERVGSKVDGPALTASTVADDYVAALTSYDYASSMAAKRLSYPDGLTFNMDNRPQYTPGGAFQSGYHNVYVSFVYEDGEWCVYASGGTKPVKTEYKLSDNVGEWNHFTYAIKTVCTEAAETSKSTTGYTYGYSKASLYFNGYALASGVTLLSSNAANAAHINPRAINMQPKHYSDEYSMGIDNFVATYYPVVTKAYVADSEGNPTTTRDPMNDVHYASGDGVVGIDDLFAGSVSSIAECEDVVYSASYVAPAPNGYATVGGVNYYVPAYAAKQIGASAKNGDVFETSMNLVDLTIPEGVKEYRITCPENVQCSLSAEAAKYASIEKTETGYRIYRTYIYGNDYRYSDGSDKSFYAGNGAGSQGSYSTLASATHSGNTYTQYAYKADATTRYRYDFMLGGYDTSDLTKGYQAREHSYFTIDFDIFADKYVYTDGDGNQVLSDTIPEGVTDYKLAYADGMNVSLDLRTIASATATSYGSTFPHPVRFNYIDGDWHIFANSTDTGLVLSRNLYEANHFTFAAKIDITEDGLVSASTRLYINGELIKTNTVKVYDFTIRAIDWYNTDENTAAKNAQRYSVGIDNLTANYYSLGYTSGDMKGVDDLFADGTTAATVDYDGIVYNADYPLDPSVNGYVQVAGGEKIYNPVLARRAVEAAAAGSVITATSSVQLADPSVAPLTFSSENGSFISLGGAAVDAYALIKSSSDGVTTYTVREPVASDAITLKWVDSLGNVIATETLAPITAPVSSDKNATLLDIDAGTGEIVAGWYWDLDGEGTYFAEAAIATYRARDIERIGGTTVTVYPKMTDVTLPASLEYIAYVIDGDITRLGDNNVARFEKITNGSTENLKNTFEQCYDGTVIKLVGEADSIVLTKGVYYGYSGKSVTLDLNGKTITRYNITAYGAALIRIGEGATAIVTSSKPGARVFLASKRGSTVEGNGNNRIFGADGIVQTNAGVDSAHVEISNLEFNGGTMIKFDGILPDDNYPTWSNNVSITATVKNVVVYSPNRSSYAVFATLCPDVVINIEDSKFYVPDGTYSLFHDYEDVAKDVKYYKSETDVTIKNSEILCYTEAATPAFAKLWFTMGKDSSMYVENTKIIAQLYNSNKGGTFSWGPGCEIATNTTISAFKAADVVSGVSYIVNKSKTDAELTLSHKRADFTTNWSYVDETNGKYIDSVYTNTVDITRSALISFITYKDPTDTQFMAKVDWKDQNGGELKSSYELIGTTATAPVTLESLGLSDVVTAWYTDSYAWAGADGTLVVKAGENVFAPVMSTATHIDGKQANMSLTTGMIFNLYIPVPDESIKAGSVYSPDSLGVIETVKVGGADMLKLSFASELDDFAPTAVNICFTTAEGRDLSYEVKIDALRYVTLLAEKYVCGTDEAQLAYEIVAYKKAVATYLATAEGKTLDTYLDESENAALQAFEAVFAAHADGCVCTDGLYSDEEIGDATMDTDAYSAVGISGFAYLLNSDNNGLRINVGEGITVKYVSYLDLSGTEVVHDEALENLKLIETETERYYVVYGVSASDTTATFTITMGDDSTVTYSLAQYINSTNADIAKALYSYAKAAAAYKTVTADEQ